MKSNKFNFETIFLFVLVFLNPVFDLCIGLLIRFGSGSFSYGGYFRLFTIFAIGIYYLFYVFRSAGRFERRNFFLVGILFLIYLGIFTLLGYSDYGVGVVIQEITYAMRYLSFLVFFIGLRPIIKKVEKNTIYNILVFTSFIYSILIVIPFVTNTSFDSYTMEGLKGSVGWFSGANEIGFIIGFTSIISIESVFNKGSLRDNLILKISSIVIPTVALLIIGTKAALLFCGLYFLFLLLLAYKKLEFKSKNLLLILISSVLLVGLFLSPAMSNFLMIFEGKSMSKIIHVLLSGRLTFFNRTYGHFISADLMHQLFGIGFMTYNVTGTVIVVDKLIEMDLFDILFRLGFVGFGLYVSTVIMKLKETPIKRKEHNMEYFLLLTNIVVAVVLSFLIGHVFSAPSVSLFFAIYLLVFIDKLN